MKILVTGGAGYLGSALVPLLLGRKHAVRVVDSLLYGGESLLPYFTDNRFDFMYGDLRESDTVSAALDGVEAVVHLAAIVGDPACARQPDVARQVNTDASVQLYKMSKQFGITRFLFASTCSNYGRMGPQDKLADENFPLRPVSLYAGTKVAVEQELTASHDCDVTILRFATLFGISPRMRFDLTVNEFTMELFIKRDLEIFGEKFFRPYVHVHDAARAVALVLEKAPSKNGATIFNVGSTEQNYRKDQLVEIVTAAIGGNFTIKRVERAEDPRDYRVSFERIKRELGFVTTKGVREGVVEIIRVLSNRIIENPYDGRFRN